MSGKVSSCRSFSLYNRFKHYAEANMYATSFSHLNPKCEARETPAGGCGVHARESIARGELISLWGGRIVHKDELDPSMPRFTQRVLQMDDDLYLLTAEEKEPTDC